MTFQERKWKKLFNYDVTVHSVSPEKKKKVTKLDTRLQSSWNLACITEMWEFFSFSFGWLPGIIADLNLVTAVLSFTMKSTFAGVLAWEGRNLALTSELKSSLNSCVHIWEGWECAPGGQWSQNQRRWGMKKCNYNLMLGVLLWEQSPYALVPQEQSLSWNQTLFSSVRCLGSWSGQCIYLPLIPKLQSISDGTLVLCLSLIDTAGYKVLFVMVWVFLLIMHHHPVSHLPIFCAKVQSLCLVFVWLFFFFICQHMKAPLSLFDKAKAVMSAAIQLVV